jgi:hypothetical protein
MIEYIISKKAYDAIIKSYKGKLKNPKVTVIEYINKTAGLRGEVIDIHIKG